MTAWKTQLFPVRALIIQAFFSANSGKQSEMTSGNTVSKFSLGLRERVARITHLYLEGLGALWGRLEETARGQREGCKHRAWRVCSLTSGLQGECCGGKRQGDTAL